MKGIIGEFTDYDTIYFDDGTKMIVSDYFNFFENNVKTNKITNCSYDAESEIFKYCYNNSEYRIKVKNNSRKLRILLGLMQLENSQKLDKENKELEEKRKEKLLNDARNGKIETEEAKQLYLKELKGKKRKLLIKMFDLSKFFKHNLSKINKFEIENCSSFGQLVCCLFAIISMILTAGSVIGIGWIAHILLWSDSVRAGFIGLLLYLVDLVYAGALVFGGFVPAFAIMSVLLLIPMLVLYFPIASVTQIIKNYIRNKENLKVINHEIKTLKDYSVPSEEINISNKSETTKDSLTKEIYEIYAKINDLDAESKKDALRRLSSIINQYQTKVKNIKAGELTLESEDYCRNKAISELHILDTEISSKLSHSNDDNSLEQVVSVINNEVAMLSEEKPLKRTLARK